MHFEPSFGVAAVLMFHTVAIASILCVVSAAPGCGTLCVPMTVSLAAAAPATNIGMLDIVGRIVFVCGFPGLHVVSVMTVCVVLCVGRGCECV